MVRSGERAYAYAKACGIIGKSFVGRRIGALRPLSRLSELDRLVFSGAARELPERELLPDLERRIIGRSVNAVLSIVNCFDKPPEFLVLLVRNYEYADLKTALASLDGSGKEKEKPPFTDLGRFGTVRFDLWPDIEAMIRGTEFDPIYKNIYKNHKSRDKASGTVETALDRHYYQRLWKALFTLKKTDRLAAEKIIREEITLRNAAWALRLRVYYGMNADEVKTYLIDIPGHDELLRDAVAALDFPLDSRREWERWKLEGCLNRETGNWRADPRSFQNAAAERLYVLALQYFRRRPLSLDTVFCFIKLKQFEEDLLTSGAEGLGIGISSRDVFDLLEMDL
ncbi:MAG: V-type ATPase subunit [Treponema sp.]|nr:V-type ATPase subunit [Treponema sp.]